MARSYSRPPARALRGRRSRWPPGLWGRIDGRLPAHLGNRVNVHHADRTPGRHRFARRQPKPSQSLGKTRQAAVRWSDASSSTGTTSRSTPSGSGPSRSSPPPVSASAARGGLLGAARTPRLSRRESCFGLRFEAAPMFAIQLTRAATDLPAARSSALESSRSREKVGEWPSTRSKAVKIWGVCGPSPTSRRSKRLRAATRSPTRCHGGERGGGGRRSLR